MAPRPIDHLVLAVPDLGAAMTFYGRLGFTVGARNLHPWGTENAVVQLEGSFLELIGLGDGFVVPGREAAAAPFAVPVAAAVARGGGLALVAMGSTDADADAALFLADGVGQGRRLDFGRTAVAADGTRRDVAFSLAFGETGLPEAGVFTCHHHRPENFWNPAAQRHANGTLRLEAVALVHDGPALVAPALSSLLGTAPQGPPHRPRFTTPAGCIDVLRPEEAAARFGGAPAAGRFAGFGVVVASLAPVRRCLAAAGVPHHDIAGALVVPPDAAFGTALAFALAPCHALA